MNNTLRRVRPVSACTVMVLTTLVAFGAFRTARANEPERPTEILLEKVEKVYSDGKWNGRPNIALWKGQYFIFFRTGSRHDSKNGAIRMMHTYSNSPRQWSTSSYTPRNYKATVAAGKSLDPIEPGPEATVVIDTPYDDQEAHVLVTPERLFVYDVAGDAATGAVVGTLVSYTDNGKDWSEPELVYEKGWSFWKPRSHGGVHYVVADVMTGGRRLELLKSTDGITWTKVSTIQRGALTETAIVFRKDGSLIALARQGWLFKSAPPYTDWSSNRYRTSVDGPALEIVGDTILASGRGAAANYPSDDQIGTRRTVLLTLNPETLELNWKMNLLTQWGGDLSYPHILALDNRRAVMTWYDGQRYEEGVPKQADLMLAILRVLPGDAGP